MRSPPFSVLFIILPQNLRFVIKKSMENGMLMLKTRAYRVKSLFRALNDADESRVAVMFQNKQERAVEGQRNRQR